MLATRYQGPIQQPAVFNHRLNDKGLASDEALASLLDHYPADLLDINLYDYDEEGQVTLRTGARGKLNGAGLLEAIQAGRLWVNMRDIQTGWPELWAAASEDFHHIEAQFPGLKAIKRAGQLILSSPKARVPYHFDAAGVVLFHMRGRKRVFVYPGDEAHLPEKHMELVVAKQTTEEVPYRLGFEEDARIIDLEAGQALTWPLYAPHRVENLDRFCVSLSMDFQTWSTRLRNGALYTNAVVRRRGGKPRTTDAMGVPELVARWATSLALKKAGVMPNRIADIQRDFEPAPDATDGVRSLSDAGTNS